MNHKIKSALIGIALAVPLSLYAVGQQKLSAEAHKDTLRPEPIRYAVELPEVPEPEEIPVADVKYFDVPLSEELQDHIFAECEARGIAPAIIISMIEQESQYDASVVGDDGESTGLMQVQTKWHGERMERLGVTDLLDPFENVTVGIDYLEELLSREDDLYWVLMAYNSGPEQAYNNIEAGKISDYALEIVERAAEMERMWD